MQNQGKKWANLTHYAWTTFLCTLVKAI